MRDYEQHRGGGRRFVWMREHDTCKETYDERIRLCFAIYITLGYVIQGLSSQLQHRRTIFLVRDSEGCPLFRQASTDVLTTGVTDDDDVPCSCAGVALSLRDLRFWHDIGIQLEVREQIVRKPLGNRHGAVQSSPRDHDFEPSGGAQD